MTSDEVAEGRRRRFATEGVAEYYDGQQSRRADDLDVSQLEKT